MNNVENEELARVCRLQAGLASTSDARDALIELAEKYEAEAPKLPVLGLGEGAGEKLE